MNLNQSHSDSIALVDAHRPSTYVSKKVLGVDLGQAQDHTAFVAVERVSGPRSDKPIFNVRGVHRVQLGVNYTQIVAMVMNLLSGPHLRGADLVLDVSGVGRGIFDMFVGYRGVTPIGVLFTSGNATTNEGSIWKVPKFDLVSNVQGIFYEGRLKIQKNLTDAPTLINELKNYKGEYTETGYLKMNARSGEHDDLLMALCLAVWHASRRTSFDNAIEFMEQAAGSGGWYRPAASLEGETVKLKRPANSTATTLYTMTGERLDIVDGVVEVTDGDQATALLQAGWQPVEAVQP